MSVVPVPLPCVSDEAFMGTGGAAVAISQQARLEQAKMGGGSPMPAPLPWAPHFPPGQSSPVIRAGTQSTSQNTLGQMSEGKRPREEKLYLLIFPF